MAAIGLHICIGSVVGDGVSGQWWIVALGVLAMCATLAATGIAAAVTRGEWATWLIPIGVALSSVFAQAGLVTIVAAVVEVLSLLMLMTHVRHEEVGRIRFSVLKLLTYGMTLTITLFLAAIATFAYAGFSRSESTTQLQSSIVDGTVTTLNASLPLVVKNYAPEMTVDELLEQQLPNTDELVQGLRQGGFTADERQRFEDELRADGIDPSAVDLDRLFSAQPEQREALFREIDVKIGEARRAAIAAARDRIAESFKVTLSGTERVDGAMRKILLQYVERFTHPNERFVPPLLAISVFLTLAIFTGIYTWIVWLFGMLIFLIYRGTHIVTKVEEEVVAIRYEVL